LTVRIPAHYGDVAILDNVTLTVSRGETLGVVGESGSGKSLLGYAFLGMLPVTAVVSGSLNLLGQELIGAPETLLRSIRGRRVALVYQDALSALNPNRRIDRQFFDVWHSHDLGPRNRWRDAALEACRRVALRDPERILVSYPHELSGGMRQRVLISLALFAKPQVLVADEPTTALDRATAEQILELLRELQVELGMSLILISHDIGLVRAVCDRIAVLYAGQLCELGSAEEVIRRPYHRYTEALVRSAVSLRRATYPLDTIPGAVPHPESFPPGCRFNGRCGAGTSICEGRRPRVGEDRQEAWCFHPPQRQFPERVSG
jgi:oligopeptide/dipeptide ABC transporter ATP-binding protein